MASLTYVVLFFCAVWSSKASVNSIQDRHRHRQVAAHQSRAASYPDTCSSVLCPLGTHCVNKEIQCHLDSCPNVAVCEPTKSFPNFCDQEIDTGSCGTGLDAHPEERWFYNTSAAQCQPFQYTGCGGNDNKYLTKEHCQRSCVRLEECYLKPEAGPCRARFIRYSYDVLEGVCKTFLYGGCRGNGNNFVTFDSCMQKCYISEFENPDFSESILLDD